MAKIFADVTETEITRTISMMFNETINEYANCDVIIIGAGPAGLTASRELGRMGARTLVIEQNNYLGGGYWVGGYMMNPVTVRAPAQKVCDAGVRFLQLTKFDDLVMKNKRVCGVVVNWMPVSALPRNITCVDPIGLECKIVIDASGHDSVAVKRLMDRGYVKWKGMDPMWVEGSEDAVVNYTDEVFPGLIASGMSVTETHGLPRMGPTFGSMLLSGKRAAEVAMGKLKEMPDSPKLKVK